MKSWRATQAGLQKVMNIPWSGAILRNCHSEWSEIKIIFHPDKKTNHYKSRKDICLPDAALNPRQGLTACTIKCQSHWSIKTVWLYSTNSTALRRKRQNLWIIKVKLKWCSNLFSFCILGHLIKWKSTCQMAQNGPQGYQLWNVHYHSNQSNMEALSMNPNKLFSSPSYFSLLSIQFLLCGVEWIEQP